MAILAFFILILVGVAVLGGISFGASFAMHRNRLERSHKQEAFIATKALRSIANGAGNPTLEAEIALDSINNLEMKELN